MTTNLMPSLWRVNCRTIKSVRHGFYSTFFFASKSKHALRQHTNKIYSSIYSNTCHIDLLRRLCGELVLAIQHRMNNAQYIILIGELNMSTGITCVRHGLLSYLTTNLPSQLSRFFIDVGLYQTQSPTVLHTTQSVDNIYIFLHLPLQSSIKTYKIVWLVLHKIINKLLSGVRVKLPSIQTYNRTYLAN